MITRIEQRMIDEGISTFTQYDMNTLIMRISEKIGKLPYEITADVILQHHKNLKIDILADLCEEEIIKGFKATNGHFYRTNRDDQINMIGQKDVLNTDSNLEETVFWKTEDAGYISHTKDEWLKVYAEAFEHKKNQLLKYNELKTKILNATTHEVVVNTDWIANDSQQAPTETVSQEPEG